MYYLHNLLDFYTLLI